MRPIVPVAIVVLWASLNGIADPSPQDAFAKLAAEAKANLETPAGRAYDQALSTYFEQNNRPLMQDCFKTVKKPDATPFEMVFTLTMEGKVKALSVWPETN